MLGGQYLQGKCFALELQFAMFQQQYEQRPTGKENDEIGCYASLKKHGRESLAFQRYQRGKKGNRRKQAQEKSENIVDPSIPSSTEAKPLLNVEA